MVTRSVVGTLVFAFVVLGFSYPNQAGAVLLRIQSVIGQLSIAYAETTLIATEPARVDNRAAAPAIAKGYKNDVIGVLLGMDSEAVLSAVKAGSCVERLRSFAARRLDYQEFSCAGAASPLSSTRSTLRVEYSKKQRVYRVSYTQEVNMGFEDFHTRAYAVYSDSSSSSCTYGEREVIETTATLTWCYSRGDGSIFAVSRKRDLFKVMLADRRIRDEDTELAKEPRF